MFENDIKKGTKGAIKKSKPKNRKNNGERKNTIPLVSQLYLVLLFLFW